ncbi:Do family serine endopeptidase [Endothiovibrio diazotrophicus]
MKPNTPLPRAALSLLILAVLAGLLWLVPGEQRRQVVELTVSDRASGATTLSGPVSYAPAVEKASPAVVNVYTSKTITRRSHPLLDDPLFRELFGNLAGPRQQTQTSLGSGVIVSPEGYVLTNHHVVEGADQIELLLADGRAREARVIGSDPDTDLAVLQVDIDQPPSIVLGDSSKLRVGDVVLAIGNPFGVGQTVTQGIVSATGRSRLGLSTYENFIQTDAAINPGNSGGALINAFGELVGINTAIFSKSGGSQGIGFAIPVQLARQVLEQIIEHGHALRGWLGVEIQDITPELAESFRLPESRGALIAGVLRQGPAHRAGMQPGDVVTEAGEQAIHDATDLLNHVAQQPPGTHLKLTGIRNGRPFAIDATVGERPEAGRK